MTSITTERSIAFDPALRNPSTGSLVIQDLEFESTLATAEADELAGEGFLSGLAGAAVGGIAGAAGGFAGYATGKVYDGVTGGGWSWSWRDAGKYTSVGAVSGAVTVGVTAALLPAP